MLCSDNKQPCAALRFHSAKVCPRVPRESFACSMVHDSLTALLFLEWPRSCSHSAATYSGPDPRRPSNGRKPLQAEPVSQKCCKALLVLVGRAYGRCWASDRSQQQEDLEQSWPAVSLTPACGELFCSRKTGKGRTGKGRPVFGPALAQCGCSLV